MKDLYGTLKVDSKASDKDIKKAYHKLASIFHPDMETGDDSVFKEIKYAYDILSNKEKRKMYDNGDPVDDTPESALENEARNALALLFTQIIENVQFEVESDLIKILKENVSINQRKFSSDVIALKNLKSKYKKVLSKIKSENKLLIKASTSKINVLDKQIIAVSNSVRVGDKILEILDEHKYDFNQELQETPYQRFNISFF